MIKRFNVEDYLKFDEWELIYRNGDLAIILVKHRNGFSNEVLLELQDCGHSILSIPNTAFGYSNINAHHRNGSVKNSNIDFDLFLRKKKRLYYMGVKDVDSKLQTTNAYRYKKTLYKMVNAASDEQYQKLTGYTIKEIEL